jgi:hypothetical protein
MTATRPPCDFCCSTTTGRWIHGSRDINFIASGPYGTAGYTALGAWVSCDACLVFIQRGDPDGLADRVARSKNGPAELLRMTSLKFRRTYFRGLYRGLLRRLQPARPLTKEAAERWAAAMEGWRPSDEASSRAVAATLETR